MKCCGFVDIFRSDSLLIFCSGEKKMGEITDYSRKRWVDPFWCASPGAQERSAHTSPLLRDAGDGQTALLVLDSLTIAPGWLLLMICAGQQQAVKEPRTKSYYYYNTKGRIGRRESTRRAEVIYNPSHPLHAGRLYVCKRTFIYYGSRHAQTCWAARGDGARESESTKRI